MKITSLLQLFDILPPNERLIVDVLRQIILENLPHYCKEKISFNVPYFYGHKGICIIWPSTVPRGGIKEGVLLGFWYGNKLNDTDNYLSKGTNKQIFYKIYHSPEEIDEEAIVKLLKKAVRGWMRWQSSALIVLLLLFLCVFVFGRFQILNLHKALFVIPHFLGSFFKSDNHKKS